MEKRETAEDVINVTTSGRTKPSKENLTSKSLTTFHYFFPLKINLRFVEKMYSFPDNLRNPSCGQENLKCEKK